jgi:hypothetical protein
VTYTPPLTRLDFKLRSNVDWSQSFRATRNGNSKVSVDLTTAHLRMNLAGLDISTANGRIALTDPPNGVFSIKVAADDLFAVPPGFYHADLLAFGADGSVTTVFVADIEIEEGDTTTVLS